MDRRAWALVRAGGLALAATLLAPVDPLVLLAVPLAVTLAAFRPRSAVSLALAAALLVPVFLGARGEAWPLWTAERGWALALAGGFVAATVLRPRWSLLARAIAGVAGAGAVTAVVAVLRPGVLAELDWWVQHELLGVATEVYQWLPGVAGDTLAGVDPAVRVLELQERLYPALLGLASLASLGVAWHVVTRLAGREPTLAPFREFRFSDHLVWVVLAGLFLLTLPPDAVASRVGGNALLFAGALYLLRGVAVLFWVGAATLTSAWTAAACVAAAVLLYPLALAVALALGIGDTWIDVRRRLVSALAGGGTGDDGR
jgi:hypothetical protein